MSCQYVLISCKCNSNLTDELILIKLYTVAVYDLRMCIEEDIRGQISREIISSAKQFLLSYHSLDSMHYPYLTVFFNKTNRC